MKVLSVRHYSLWRLVLLSFIGGAAFGYTILFPWVTGFLTRPLAPEAPPLSPPVAEGLFKLALTLVLSSGGLFSALALLVYMVWLSLRKEGEEDSYIW